MARSMVPPRMRSRTTRLLLPGHLGWGWWRGDIRRRQGDRRAGCRAPRTIRWVLPLERPSVVPLRVVLARPDAARRQRRRLPGQLVRQRRPRHCKRRTSSNRNAYAPRNTGRHTPPSYRATQHRRSSRRQGWWCACLGTSSRSVLRSHRPPRPHRLRSRCQGVGCSCSHAPSWWTAKAAPKRTANPALRQRRGS